MGTNGKPACRYCHGDITNPRRTSYCKQECAHEFKLRNEPEYARAVAFLRDRGVCKACGLDTFAASERPLPHWVEDVSLLFAKFPTVEEWVSGKQRNHFPIARWMIVHGEWELDHVVELADGGGGGLDNLQSLCPKCHREKTSASATARAERRRASK